MEHYFELRTYCLNYTTRVHHWSSAVYCISCLRTFECLRTILQPSLARHRPISTNPPACSFGVLLLNRKLCNNNNNDEEESWHNGKNERGRPRRSRQGIGSNSGGFTLACSSRSMACASHNSFRVSYQVDTAR